MRSKRSGEASKTRADECKLEVLFGKTRGGVCKLRFLQEGNCVKSPTAPP